VPQRRLLAALAAALAAAWAGCGERGEPVAGCEPADGRTPVCAFSNPEDLAPAGGGWVLVSQYPEAAGTPGSLAAWRPPDGTPHTVYPPAEEVPAPDAGAEDAECDTPPDPALFAPHGIDLAPGHGGSRLWVVNHGGREAVERFRVERGGDGAPRLVWEDCVRLPEEAQANDVVALPDGGFAVTWFMSRASGVGLALAFARIALGLDTGRVLVWRPEDGFVEVPGSEASAPNGLEVSADGRTLFVAAWGDGRLLRIPLDEAGAEPAEAELPHHPDNLTWAPDGRLLVAGQEGSLADVVACTQVEEGACGLAWSVVAVRPEDLAVDLVVRESPAATTGGASVALETDGRLLVGTFHGDRIVWMPR
jgi:hypothetical protein